MPTLDTNLFRDSFNASPIGIVVETMEGQPLFINPAFCSMLGFTEAEIQKKHCVDFSPPEDAQKDWDLFQQLRAGSIDHYQLEKRYFRRDGSLMWGRLSLSLLNDRATPFVLAMVEDITEQKRAQNSEAVTFETLDLVTRQMTAAVSRCSRDLRYLWVNQAYADWIQRPVNEIIGRPIGDVLGKGAFEALLPVFHRVLAGEKVHDEHEQTFHGIGKRSVSATLTPTLDEHGIANGWVAVIKDITDDKRAEEARFRHTAIVESSEDAIISKDLDANIVSWNAGAQHIFGYAEAEVVGRPITVLIPPELHEEESRILERLRAGKQIEHYETIRVTKAGKKVDVSLNLSPIKNSGGKVVGYCKIARDITRRKEAERSMLALNRSLSEQAAWLQSREELLKIFVQNVPAGVAMFDRDMRYLEVSDRWCADYGIDKSQVLGRSHYEVFPDMPSKWKEMHRRGLGGETMRADEERWDREGGTKWVRWEIRPWWHVDKVPGGILIFAEDITQRKHMEQAISGVSRKLVEAQERERARIGRELHDDVNQRLALLSVEVEQLQRDPSEIESGVRDLRKHISELSKDVQALAHDLHPARLEYLGAIAGMKSWTSEFAQRQRMEVDFTADVRSSLPSEIGITLFRVLQEALQNTVKHSGSQRIEVELREDSKALHLTVRDSGKGFDVEAASRGKGLGLTSMRERIRLVNGTISIHSMPNSGTAIQVRVPLGVKHESHPADG